MVIQSHTCLLRATKGAATLLDRSFLLYPVLPRPGAGGACCRLRTDPFWDGMMMSRKRLLVERRRNGKDEVGMVWMCSGVVFSACGRGSRGCQCLERRAEFVGGRQKTAAPPIPQLLSIFQ